MSDLKEISLFSGIGGISLGLQRAGVSTALLCEYDKHARGILTRHYPHAAIHNDVTELTADDCRAAGAVPGRTILTAGWPCQGNSVAGRRGGMDDPRSGLWSHVVRVLADLRPAWFIGENVPGLLSVNDGRDFGVVVHDLAGLGYGFAWRVLDARYFGVPQRRRRVVIVGRLGDTGAASAQVLLEPEGVPGDPAAGITPRPRPAGHARAGDAVGRVVGVLGGHAHTLTAEGHDASEDGTGRGTPIVYIPSTAGTLVSHGGNDKHDTTRMTYVAHEVSTLTAAGGERGYRIDAETAAGGHLLAGGNRSETGVRRLTPLECERLQGFPDDWTEGQADSHRSKQLGNSVAVPVFEWVGRRLVAVDGAP
jgi:DNA (cytosine-5)-methyltransferase 1